MMSLRFEFFDSNKHSTSFSDFVDTTYGSSFFLKSEKYIQWWFGTSPSQRSSKKLNILLAINKDEIIGMNGVILTPLCGHSTIKTIGWLANTMVKAEYRNRGLGMLLVKKSVEKLELSGSISFKPAARNILEYLQYQISNRQMRRSIIIIDKDKFLSFSNPLITDIKVKSSKASTNSFVAREISDSNIEIVSSIWDQCKSRYGITTNRTIDFFIWRYINHPEGKYYFLVPPTDSPKSVAILRIEYVANRNIKIARIVDVFGFKNQIYPLLESLESWLATKKICYGDFFCNRTPDEEAFEASNFFWMAEGSEGSIPFLFQPLTLGVSYSEGIAIKTSNNLNIEQMYITRGDSDRDRPVINHA